MAETLIVSVVVAGAATYVVWTLLPQPARRFVARLAGRPEPAAGCNACGGGADCSRPAATERPVTIFRRR